MRMAMALGFCAALAASSASAQSGLIPYEGQLLDDGVAASGSYVMTFELYVPSDEMPAWSSVQNVDVTDGRFFVELGDEGGDPIPDALLASPLSLKIRVDDVALDGSQQLYPALQAVSATQSARFTATQAASVAALVVHREDIDETWELLVGGGGGFNLRPLGEDAPFAVQGGYPDALRVMADGRVGLGTAVPETALHIVRDDGNARLHVDEFAEAVNHRVLMRLRNRGAASAQFVDSTSTNNWIVGTRDADGFRITSVGSGTDEFTVRADGALEVTGSVVARGAEFSANDGTARLTIEDTQDGAQELLTLRNAGPVALRVEDTANSHVWTRGVNADGDYYWDSDAQSGVEMRLTESGELILNGTTMTVPDYVFDPGYSLSPLDEVEAHIAAHGHLPGIPSAEEMGQELRPGQLSLQLLEKVEELTLYTLQQQRELDAMRRQNLELKARLDKIEADDR